MGHKRLALSVRRLLESRSCGLIVRVHSGYAGMADEMDSRTSAWFQRSVERVQELDRLFGELSTQSDSVRGNMQEFGA